MPTEHAHEPQSPPITRGRVVAGWIAAERARCRRPIAPGEVENLEALGAQLRELREQAGLSRPVLAERAELGKTQIELIERGARRTRRSTLRRIAVALVTDRPDFGNPDELADTLASLAGPALALESDYADRIARRRKRRHRKRERAAEGERKEQRQREARELLAQLARIFQ